eukprot:TRINITY_DN26698_c0_g1_i1.p3 TRINITY_DN26698_c0_g1~~TRINITY_DN26698_c0_g1_i1.p3  ORF type:complete len:101 (-),score=6.49 TRINITY_DN26698_c0_g1_i1:86-388(-)
MRLNITKATIRACAASRCCSVNGRDSEGMSLGRFDAGSEVWLVADDWAAVRKADAAAAEELLSVVAGERRGVRGGVREREQDERARERGREREQPPASPT